MDENGNPIAVLAPDGSETDFGEGTHEVHDTNIDVKTDGDSADIKVNPEGSDNQVDISIHKDADGNASTTIIEEPGTESFTSTELNKVRTKMQPTMDGPMIIAAQAMPPDVPFIRKSPNSNSYRIYISTNTQFSPLFNSTICKFLDSRSHEDSVTFMLGVGVGEDITVSHEVSSIIHSMKSAEYTTTAIAMGMCSVSETFLWMNARNRLMTRYGALTFGTGAVIELCDAYREFYRAMMDTAVVEQLITTAQAEAILKTNKQIMYTAVDFKKMQNTGIEFI